MRWLLLKDLRILRRSPLLVGVLVAYPIVIAILIGLALSRAPERPRVAFVNEVASADTSFEIGGQRLDASRYADELFRSIDPVRVGSRAAAVELVRSGDVLGALIVPAAVTRRLQEAINLSGSGERPRLEVIYNIEDPLKAQAVESAIKARLGDANRALSGELTKLASRYLNVLLSGGRFSLLGQDFDVLGLQRSKGLLEQVAADLPPGSPAAAEIRRVAAFAQLAIENLDLSDEVLATVGEPIAVKRTVLKGASTPLEAFAVSVAVTISLMFVTILLGAGMLALEREEHAYGRLVRGLVSRVALLAEKVVLCAACAFAVTLAMLAGIGAFVDLDWGRAPLWMAALAAGALAFGALGVALGALAREVRAASLLAFGLALPIAFLALVPAGAVAATLQDVIGVVSALFPFRPALRAIDAAVNDAEPGITGALVHLGVLTVAYVAIARLALGRFA